MNTIVKAHAKKVRAKVHQVSPPLQPITEFEKAQLVIQMRQLHLMESNAAKQQDSGAMQKQAEKSKSLVLAKKKFDAFFEDSSSLTDIVTKYPTDNLTDPDKCLDQDIRGMMREVGGWRGCLKDLTKTYKAFHEITVVHKLADSQMDAIDV